jgi:hypothetical protein
MSLYEILSLTLEVGVLGVLLLEYFYGRPDLVIKNEQKQKKRLRQQKDFEYLNQGEHK